MVVDEGRISNKEKHCCAPLALHQTMPFRTVRDFHQQSKVTYRVKRGAGCAGLVIGYFVGTLSSAGTPVRFGAHDHSVPQDAGVRWHVQGLSITRLTSTSIVSAWDCGDWAPPRAAWTASYIVGLLVRTPSTSTPSTSRFSLSTIHRQHGLNSTRSAFRSEAPICRVPCPGVTESHSSPF